MQNTDIAVQPKPLTISDLLLTMKYKDEDYEMLDTRYHILWQKYLEATSKPTYYDVILADREPMDMADIAKDYGMRTRKLIHILEKQCVLFKLNTVWLVYPEYAQLGYTKTEGKAWWEDFHQWHQNYRLKWTQKGRLFLYHLLREAGYRPVMEGGTGKRNKLKED